MFLSNKNRDNRDFITIPEKVVGLALVPNADGSFEQVDSSILNDNSHLVAEDFSIKSILEHGNSDLLQEVRKHSTSLLDKSDSIDSIIENTNFVKSQIPNE